MEQQATAAVVEQMETEQQQQQPAPEQEQTAAAAARTLHLNAGQFVEDLHRVVGICCNNIFDNLDSSFRENYGPRLTAEQRKEYLDGSMQLYLALKAEADAQLQKFEEYALETCLHVPAGLLLEHPSAGGEGEAGAVDEAEEAAVDEQLVDLRRRIAATKHRSRKLVEEVARYDASLAQYSTSLADLAAVVPAALGGKENAVAEDSAALAAGAVQLEESCRKLEALRVQKQRCGSAGSSGEAADGSNSGGVLADGLASILAAAMAVPKDDLAAEKEILRRQAGVRSAPADDLRRLQERLAG